MVASFSVLLPLALSSLPSTSLYGPIVSILLSAVLLSQNAANGNAGLWFPAALARSMWAALLIRGVIVLSTVLHEFVHLAVASFFVRSRLCLKKNWSCNVPLSQWLQCLVPIAPWPATALPHVCVPALSQQHDRLVRLAAPVVSVLLALGVTFFQDGTLEWVAVEMAVWMVAFGSIATDVLRLGTCKSGMFSCGNFGMLVITALDKASSVDIKTVLTRMAGTTAARGGQSGGLVTILDDGVAHRTRYVPSKRADVAVGLVSSFMRGVSLKGLIHRGTSACSFFLGHTRFATSSAPKVNESHPHRFSDPKKVMVWRCTPQGWVVNKENFEIYVTHNGDLDYWSVFGRQRTQRELGSWLVQVLDMRGHVAGCDSVKVAGILELLRTQGVWLHAIRLAFQQTVSPPFESTVAGTSVLPRAELMKASDAADAVFADFVKTSDMSNPEQAISLAQKLVTAWERNATVLTSRCSVAMVPLEAMARKTVEVFLENDMFAAMSRFLGDAHGSFGLSACCTLDRNTVCVASRGQAMCVSFHPQSGTILWGSESAAQAIPLFNSNGSVTRAQSRANDLEAGLAGTSTRPELCTHRYDLDENGGEVLEFSVWPNEAARNASERACSSAGEIKREFGLSCTEARFVPFLEMPSLHMRVVRYHPMRCIELEEFTKTERLINMSKVLSVPSPHVNVRDKVAGDLMDIPRVMRLIRTDWTQENGHNRRTAASFFKMLQDLVLTTSSEGDLGRLEVDVLITAVEASLWIAEQFASDLQALFPSVRVVPISANKVIGVLSNHRGSAPMTGFSFCSLTMSLKRTIVIAVSHSGQTFPTLHATHALKKIVGNRLFVLTGSVDSKMAAAVGQSPTTDSPWIGRIWHTFCGWRPSEALTVSTAACHHTLSELLLYCAKRAARGDADFKQASGFNLNETHIGDLRRLNDTFVSSVQHLVGHDEEGKKVKSVQRDQLIAQGRKWGLHILEGPFAWILSAIYIFCTVVSGFPLFTAIYNEAILPHLDSRPEWASKLVLGLDSLLYCFLPLWFSLLLRLLQGRQLFARLGKRTLVIGDVPYVHQLLESYVSKLFAQSYSIASIDVHGANAIDHLVHRFTHRVCRGVLIAVGRPDGRIFSLIKAESWVLMALQQCKAIVHFLAPPEVITVGHNPYRNPSVIDGHVGLESHRPKFMCEMLCGVEEHEPMERLSSINQLAKQNAASAVHEDFHKGGPIGVLALDDLSPELSRNISSELTFQIARSAQIAAQEGVIDQSSHSAWMFDKSSHVDRAPDRSNHFDRSHHFDRSQNGGSLHGVFQAASQILSHSARAPVSPDGEIVQENISAVAGPAALDRALDGVGQDLLQLLAKGTAVELWHENRYASLERYISFLVMFHAMAERVASFWPLKFDVWRSQSQLRVATTAAPISAAEVQKVWAEDAGHVEVFPIRVNTSPDPTQHAMPHAKGRHYVYGPLQSHVPHNV